MCSADLAHPSCDPSPAISPPPLPIAPCVIFIHSGAVPSVQIHTRPPQGSVFEGQELVLVCSVRGVPGPIGVSWYRGQKLRGATEIALSQDAEFKISTVKSSDAGKYYCVANSIHSTEVTIHIRGACVCQIPSEGGVTDLREDCEGQGRDGGRGPGRGRESGRRKVRGRALRSTQLRGK